MKKLMMMVVLAACCLTTSAQNTRRDAGEFTLQPKVGLAVGTLGGTFTYYLSPTQSRTSIEDEMRGAFIGGVEAEYYVNNWFSASASLMYSQQGWRMKEKVSGDKWNVNLDYINIPVLANFYVARGFAIKVGVQPGFLINAKNDGHNFKSDCESFNFSIPFGLSYEFKNGITIDWLSSLALTKVNKVSDSDNKWRSNCAWLTLGYKFSL